MVFKSAPERRANRKGNWNEHPYYGIRYPRMNHAEIAECYKSIENGGNSPNEQWEKLVLSNLPLVFTIAGDYKWSGLEFEDVVQSGVAGLMEGLKRYNRRLKNPRTGMPFEISSYVTFYIEGYMQKAVSQGGISSRIANFSGNHRNSALIFKAEKELRHEFCRNPSEKEVAERAGLPLQSVRNCRFMSAQLQRLNEDLHEANVQLPSKKPVPVGENVEMRDLCEFSFNCLEKIEQNVIKMRYGFDGRGGMTQENVAAEIGKTRSRVGQIEQRAIEKIRNHLQLGPGGAAADI
jgi:RNA polymerase primary sigma factor